MRYLLPIALLCIAALQSAATPASEFHPLPRCANMPSGPQPVYIIPYPTSGAYPQCAPATPYAYGWFGVPRRQHKGTHYGHYNNYTQHSLR